MGGILALVLAISVLVIAPLARGSDQPPQAGTEDGQVPVLVPIDPPSAAGSTSPTLASEGATTFSQGHDLLMTWLDPSEAGGRLRFARLSAKGWSPPITVAERVSTLGPADRPSLTVIDTQGVRRTLIARTGDVVARSGDAGRTWTRLPSPPLPFASFAGGDEGAYAFWLAGDGEGSARLLGTRVLAGETLLDPRAVGGAATSAAMTWDGPVVVYRAEDAAGSAEIAIVRREEAAWLPPGLVAGDGTRPTRSLPEGGPRVAALRRQLAVAWCAGTPEGFRVWVAFSSDGGRTFDAPVDLAATVEPAPGCRVDVALAENGQALVLWLAAGADQAASEATLNLARLAPDGSRGEELVLARGLAASFAGFPQITLAGERVAVSWSEGDPGQVRAVALPLAAVPPPGRKPEAKIASVAVPPPYRGRGRVGEAVPDFEVVTMDGETVSLASLRGRAVLLNFWATWCLPCLAEMPELVALQARHGEQGLTVVGMSVDSAEASDKVRKFAAERGLAFSVWLDAEMRVAGALRVRSYPTTFVLDREGLIVWRRDRAITADDPELGEALRRAMSEP